MFAVIPVLFLFCECGEAATFDGFHPFPFEQEQQLIPYCTEGQGEDKVVCVMCDTIFQALNWHSCLIALLLQAVWSALAWQQI